MPTKSLLLSAGLAGLLLTSGCTALSRSGNDGSVTVEYQNPEQFTDMTRTDNERGADQGYLRELQRYVERVGPNRIPAGHNLAITITDVDMAGDFEPHRGPDFHDIRVVKTIYPPRINLTFRLTDATGNVVAEGERQLRNMAFNWTVSPVDRDDQLRYEKDLMDDFLRDLPRTS